MTSHASHRRLVIALCAAMLGCGTSSTEENASVASNGSDHSSAAASPAPGAHTTDDVRTPETPATPAPARDARTSAPRAASDIEIPAKFAGIQLAPMGRKVVTSALAGAPGYVPLADEELASVERGRREAPYVEGRELGPEHHSSAEALARRILDLVNTADWRTLYEDVLISLDEYKTFCWPEFPSSRPTTGYEAEDAWQFHWQHALSGARRGTAAHTADLPLSFVRVEYTVGLKPFRNFFLLDGVRIHAETLDGRPIVVDFATTFIERNGRWKVYTYKD